MTWIVVEHFLARHRNDFRAILRFQDSCNNGDTLQSLAEQFRCSVPEAGRLRSVLFVQKFHLAEHTKKYLEFKLAHTAAEEEQLIDYLLENKRMEKGLIFNIDGSKKHIG